MNVTSLLLVSQIFQGFIAVLILFGLCFFSVHLFKLLIMGWESQQRPEAPQIKDEPPPPEPKPPTPQPVYYVVEKQKRRKKPRRFD